MRHLLTFVMVMTLVGCAVPVRPIAYIEQDPQRPGTYHFTPDHAQEPHVSDSVGGFLSGLVTFLPSPYRELLGILVAAWIGEKRKQASDVKLKQTVDGIEKAKADLPDGALDVLHTALASTQDASTQKTVWEMRP